MLLVNNYCTQIGKLHLFLYQSMGTHCNFTGTVCNFFINSFSLFFSEAAG